jgi:uncharacterized damage-inducible protein DinB
MALTAGPVVQAQSKAQGLTSQPHQTDSALTAETRHVFQAVSGNLLKAAREMPDKSYNFKPAKDARSFGEMISHIATVQNTLCGNINGHSASKGGAFTSKDEAVKNLEHSVAECETAFGELSAENMSKTVQTASGQLTHIVALMYIITHAGEEYGQLTTYLELNQLAPPTNDNVKGVA